MGKTYAFGIKQEENVVALYDLIEISEGGLSHINPNEITENGMDLYFSDRGISVFTKSNQAKATKLISEIELPEPNITNGPYSIYFLDNEAILFKINKLELGDVNSLRKEVKYLFKKIGLNDKEISKNINSDVPDDSTVFQGSHMHAKNEEGEICLLKEYSLFVHIKPKDFNKLKAKVEKEFKN